VGPTYGKVGSICGSRVPARLRLAFVGSPAHPRKRLDFVTVPAGATLAFEANAGVGFAAVSRALQWHGRRFRSA